MRCLDTHLRFVPMAFAIEVFFSLILPVKSGISGLSGGAIQLLGPRLNWRLMMASMEIVDYIVVHELAHLQEPNYTDTY